MQELGPWCATSVLNELLKPKHASNFIDQFSDMGAELGSTAGEPFADAISKPPSAYVPPIRVTRVARALNTLQDNTKVMPHSMTHTGDGRTLL